MSSNINTSIWFDCSVPNGWSNSILYLLLLGKEWYPYGHEQVDTKTDLHGQTDTEFSQSWKQKPNKCLTLPPSKGIDRKSLGNFPKFPWPEISGGPQIPGSLYLMVITETLIQPLREKSLETKCNHFVRGVWVCCFCDTFLLVKKRGEKTKKTLKLCHRTISYFFLCSPSKIQLVLYSCYLHLF